MVLDNIVISMGLQFIKYVTVLCMSVLCIVICVVPNTLYAICMINFAKPKGLAKFNFA